MAVIALKNAADARMNTRNAIRLNHSTRSRRVISTSLKPSASSRELLFREPAIAAFLAVIPNQVRNSCFVWANPSFERHIVATLRPLYFFSGGAGYSGNFFFV